MQTRVSASCRRDYLGMHRLLCEEEATQLYQPQNVSASRVWLVEPVVPGPPTITAVIGGCTTRVMTVTLNPPDFAGYYAISNYTVVCTPGRGPSLTASGMGKTVGGKVRRGEGVESGRLWHIRCTHTHTALASNFRPATTTTTTTQTLCCICAETVCF